MAAWAGYIVKSWKRVNPVCRPVGFDTIHSYSIPKPYQAGYIISALPIYEVRTTGGVSNAAGRTTGPIASVAPYVLAAATFIIGGIALRTIWLLLRGRLLPPSTPAVPARHPINASLVFCGFLPTLRAQPPA
ncbi:hypothetical protein V1282_000650 [Nitrobacteraceae bacterium AZCC 2146]